MPILSNELAQLSQSLLVQLPRAFAAFFWIACGLGTLFLATGILMICDDAMITVSRGRSNSWRCKLMYFPTVLFIENRIP